MLWLVGATLTASFFDCLNPSAIAQMMLLLTAVRRKRSVLFFVAGIGLTNFGMGLAAYYGATAWASRLFSAAAEAYPSYLRAALIAAGLVSLALGAGLAVRAGYLREESGEAKAVRHDRLSPLPLFAMGAAFCGVELTSALPYFGFITMTAGSGAPLPAALFLFCVYNFVYVLPLLLLYLGYNRLRGTAVISRAERAMGKISSYVVPGALVILGPVLVFFGASI